MSDYTQRSSEIISSQNIISNNLVDVIDWDVKTVINKPKDYDNSS
jgi:hypothetical protein